ncbi:MAG: glutathione S-transferase family protein [Cyanobacteria bacterium J06560_2]
MKLYFFPPSNNSRRAHAVALHLGLPMDYVLVNLQAGEQRSPEFLALNPAGRVPVLQDGDFVLWESNAIAQYLASQTTTSLWPNDDCLRAEIMGWQCWEMAHLAKATQPIQFERFVKQVLNLGESNSQVIERSLATFHQEVAILEAHLAAHPYLVNDELTIADFSVASDFTYAVPCQFPMSDYPHTQAWYDRIEALPAWQQTSPSALVEA